MQRTRYIHTRAGLDIETECAVEGCSGSGCDHALSPYRNRITVIGITNGDDLKKVFRGPDKTQQLTKFLEDNPEITFTAHTGKFDVRNLVVHGVPKELLISRWEHDSALLAFTHQDKITDSWLASYEAERVILNKTRKGNAHRPAGPHSLKTLAPYFLGVAPFWETEDHDNDDYVLKDALYSLQLTDYLLRKLPKRSLEFYKERYFKWTLNLLDAELMGIKLDLEALEESLEDNSAALHDLEMELQSLWKPHYDAWIELGEAELRARYDGMLKNALAKRGPKTDELKTINRYNNLYKEAVNKIEPLNLASPAQLAWLLRERLHLNPVNLDGEPSTDKEALELLSNQNEDVKKLITVRKLTKLATAFLPEYKSANIKGRIHTNFNVTEARTGRLSSSNLNMQQVPGDLHKLFVADEGHLLITRDLSAIEPTILAYYSEDPQLCQLMINKGDFHSTNAGAMFSLDEDPSTIKKKYPQYRGVAKTVGLAVLYGAGANQVYRTLLKAGLHQFTLQDAKAIVYRIRDLYSGVWAFKQSLDNMMENGAVIYNLLGRPLKIQNPQDAYMKAMNTLIQSSASDLLQDRVDTALRQYEKLKLLLLVHDEAVLQAPAEQAEYLGKEIERILTDFTLTTTYGNIPVRLEGKNSREWEK